MHEVILNELLNNSCNSPSSIDGWNEYRIELCCGEYIITARHVGSGECEVLMMQTAGEHELLRIAKREHSCETGGE